MNVVAWVLGVMVCVPLSIGGVMKLLDQGDQRLEMRYTKRQWFLIGVAEIAAVAGIVCGLIWRSVEWLAVAAAVGVCALMLGALMAHARVEDPAKRIVPAITVLSLTILFIIFVSIR